MKKKLPLRETAQQSFLKVVVEHKDTESLFEGYRTLDFVTYDCSLKTLNQLQQRYGFERIRGVVGRNISDRLKNGLKAQSMDYLMELSERVKEGCLRLYFPLQGKELHDKFYLLESDTSARLIIGSSNLSDNGLHARRQSNLLWVGDYAHPPQASMDYFQQILDGCELFMSDLLNLLENTTTQEEKQQAITVWLQSESKSPSRPIAQLYEHAFAPQEQESPYLVINLNKNLKADKLLQQKLSPERLRHTEEGKIEVERPYLRKLLVEEIGFPVFHLLPDKNSSILYLGESRLELSQRPDDTEYLNACLENLEQYCMSTDYSQERSAVKKKKARATLMEGILYVFTAPYFHHMQQIKRQKLSLVDKRGPAYLLLYGTTRNGKSTFVNFMLKLLSGHSIQALSAKKFKQATLDNIMETQSTFPFIIDDIPKERVKALETLLKEYWEKDWRFDRPRPQVILTSNQRDMYGWFLSRAKILDFELYYETNMAQQEALAEIMAFDNRIFCYFDHFMRKELAKGNIPDYNTDLLSISRNIFRKLYAKANRIIPEFLLDQPLEKIYDTVRDQLHELVEQDKKATLRYTNGEVHLSLAPDVSVSEVNRLRNMLQEHFAVQKSGNLLKIHDSERFIRWYGTPEDWVSRLQRWWKGMG